jgi:hypothetical protein
MTDTTDTIEPSVLDQSGKLVVLIDELYRWVKQYTDAKAKFLDRLERDPIAAFESSGLVASLASRHFVATHFLKAIDSRRLDGTLDEAKSLKLIHDVAMRNAIEAARFPKRSTCIQSNYQAAETGRAWAELYDEVKHLL